MANTLINLANHHSGVDDKQNRLVHVVYECNKKGDMTYLNKELGDKKVNANWNIETITRAFRELYSHLDWRKVFEALDGQYPI
jgi:site-specific DNA-adenine methylase